MHSYSLYTPSFSIFHPLPLTVPQTFLFIDFLNSAAKPYRCVGRDLPASRTGKKNQELRGAKKTGA